MDILYLVTVPGVLLTWSFVTVSSIPPGARSNARVRSTMSFSRALGDFRVVGGFFAVIGLALVQWMSIPGSLPVRYLLLGALPLAAGTTLALVVRRHASPDAAAAHEE